MPVQLVYGTDTRQQEQPRRVDRAGADDDLLPATDQPGISRLVDELDPGRGTVANDYPPHERSPEDLQIWSAEGWVQISTGRAPAQSAVNERLRDMQTFLPVSVVVWRHGEPGLLAAAQKGVVELVRRGAPADVQRPVSAAPVVWAISEGLHPAEVWQAMGMVPVRQAIGRPAVVIHRVAAVIDHRVDRRRAADHPAGFLVDGLAIEVRLGTGLVSPANPLALVGERQRAGHGDDEPPVGPAGFHQQNRGRRILAEPSRQDAPGRPSAHEDVVELGGRQMIPSSRSGVPSSSRCQPNRVRSIVW